MSFTDKPSPQDVTQTCLSCHPKVGQDLLKTAHWNWKGYSPTLAGYEHRTDISLRLMVNNYCIAIGSNQQQCMSCHIGYGGVDDRYDFSNPANIDCLVCHDTTGKYRKDPSKAGFPDPSLDLIAICAEGGTPLAAGLRLLSLLQRRGPQRQARGPGTGPGRSRTLPSTCTWAR